MTLRTEIEAVAPLLEFASVTSVLDHIDRGNYMGAIEMLSTDYHLQMAAGNGRHAETIDRVIDLIGETYAP